MPWASHLAAIDSSAPPAAGLAQLIHPPEESGRLEVVAGRERVEVTDDQVGHRRLSPDVGEDVLQLLQPPRLPLGPLPEAGGEVDDVKAQPLPAWGCDRHLEMAPQHPAVAVVAVGRDGQPGQHREPQRATVARRPGDRGHAELAGQPRHHAVVPHLLEGDEVGSAVRQDAGDPLLTPLATEQDVVGENADPRLRPALRPRAHAARPRWCPCR